MNAIAANWAVWQLAKVVNNHADRIGDADQYERSTVREYAYCAWNGIEGGGTPSESSSSMPLDSVFRLVEVEDYVLTVECQIHEAIRTSAAVK